MQWNIKIPEDLDFIPSIHMAALNSLYLQFQKNGLPLLVSKGTGTPRYIDIACGQNTCKHKTKQANKRERVGSKHYLLKRMNANDLDVYGCMANSGTPRDGGKTSRGEPLASCYGTHPIIFLQRAGSIEQYAKQMAVSFGLKYKSQAHVYVCFAKAFCVHLGNGRWKL